MGLANHTVLQCRDGTMIPIEDSAAPIYDEQKKLLGVMIVFRDVTAEKKAEEVLRKAEKLAAAGRLAATVAHEINNPLEAISNIVYIVKNTDGVPEDARAFLAMAEEELARVSHITRQTLGFYRDSARPADVDVSEVVRSVLRLYDNNLKSKSIGVETIFDHCGPVRGLEGELKQLVANLISNAADAVNAGGKIKIVVGHRTSSSAAGVEIAIADDGPGVPAENRSRIFEPFFTTKQDVGTGLGLWVSKEIAERHGGAISLSPTQDGMRGAVFNVFIPYGAQPGAVDASEK
jgi:signal transduction histidine kinase